MRYYIKPIDLYNKEMITIFSDAVRIFTLGQIKHNGKWIDFEEYEKLSDDDKEIKHNG